MCRLAFITERFPVGKWLKDLEKSMGGDGNGVAIGKTLFKGVNLTIDKIEGLIMNSKEPALFHTRRVSSGFKNDQLCHPFPCRKGYLAHNGHWNEGHNAACVIDDLRIFKDFASDSQVFSLIVDKIGFERAVTRYKPDGVWLFVNKKGKLFVYKNFGSLYYSPEYDAWGSEKADEGHWYAVENGYYTPGDTPKEAQWSKNFNYDYNSNKSGYNSDYRGSSYDSNYKSAHTAASSETSIIPPFRPTEKEKKPVQTIPGLYHVVPSTKEKKTVEEFNERQLPEFYKSHDFRKAGSL